MNAFIAKYKVLAGVILLALLLVGSFSAGAVINGWRLAGDHQRALTAKDKRIGELETAIANQNHAVEKMQLASDAAEQRRELAEQYAHNVLKRIGDREEAVANSKAKDCVGVLKEAWGNWQ